MSTRKGKDGWDRARVRALRMRLGVTQAAFGMALGLHPQTPARWESAEGFRPEPALVIVLELLEQKRVTLAECQAFTARGRTTA